MDDGGSDSPDRGSAIGFARICTLIVPRVPNGGVERLRVTQDGLSPLKVFLPARKVQDNMRLTEINIRLIIR